jgi:hypothetical protein
LFFWKNENDTSVGIVPGYGLKGYGLIPGRDKTHFLIHTFQTGPEAHQAPIKWVLRTNLLRVKLPE